MVLLAAFLRGGAPALQQLAESSVRLGACAGSVREFAQVALANKATKTGPGGRSSVNGLTATVFGGYGFVGPYLVNELAKRGSQVIAPFRSTEERVQPLKQMGDLGQVVLMKEFDIRDEEMVKKAISRSNVVINLVGQRMETMNFKYEEVHVKWPERLAKAVAASPHVERFIHFSDMGADERHASQRMATKGKGDRLVQELVPSATIVRPAPIVGIEDHFFNYIIYQVSLSPIAPLVEGGVNRVSPTYIHDVAEAVMRMLQRDESKGQTYYLGGPETLTYRQIYDTIIKVMRLQTDDTVHIPKSLAKLAFGPKDWARRMLPSLPMANWMYSADYAEEMTRDKVAPLGSKTYTSLDMSPQKVTDGLPIEPVRHFRVGGYRWGDMATVAKDVPEAIRKYYNLK